MCFVFLWCNGFSVNVIQLLLSSNNTVGFTAIQLMFSNNLLSHTAFLVPSHAATRQMVVSEEGVVVLEKISTKDQVADMLTKPLGKVLFIKHINKLEMRCTELYLNL